MSSSLTSRLQHSLVSGGRVLKNAVYNSHLNYRNNPLSNAQQLNQQPDERPLTMAITLNRVKAISGRQAWQQLQLLTNQILPVSNQQAPVRAGVQTLTANEHTQALTLIGKLFLTECSKRSEAEIAHLSYNLQQQFLSHYTQVLQQLQAGTASNEVDLAVLQQLTTDVDNLIRLLIFVVMELNYLTENKSTDFFQSNGIAVDKHHLHEKITAMAGRILKSALLMRGTILNLDQARNHNQAYLIDQPKLIDEIAAKKRHEALLPGVGASALSQLVVAETYDGMALMAVRGCESLAVAGGFASLIGGISVVANALTPQYSSLSKLTTKLNKYEGICRLIELKASCHAQLNALSTQSGELIQAQRLRIVELFAQCYTTEMNYLQQQRNLPAVTSAWLRFATQSSIWAKQLLGLPQNYSLDGNQRHKSLTQLYQEFGITSDGHELAIQREPIAIQVPQASVHLQQFLNELRPNLTLQPKPQQLNELVNYLPYSLFSLTDVFNSNLGKHCGMSNSQRQAINLKRLTEQTSSERYLTAITNSSGHLHWPGLEQMLVPLIMAELSAIPAFTQLPLPQQQQLSQLCFKQLLHKAGFDQSIAGGKRKRQGKWRFMHTTRPGLILRQALTTNNNDNLNFLWSYFELIYPETCLAILAAPTPNFCLYMINQQLKVISRPEVLTVLVLLILGLAKNSNLSSADKLRVWEQFCIQEQDLNNPHSQLKRLNGERASNLMVDFLAAYTRYFSKATITANAQLTALGVNLDTQSAALDKAESSELKNSEYMVFDDVITALYKRGNPIMQTHTYNAACDLLDFAHKFLQHHPLITQASTEQLDSEQLRKELRQLSSTITNLRYQEQPLTFTTAHNIAATLFQQYTTVFAALGINDPEQANLWLNAKLNDGSYANHIQCHSPAAFQTGNDSHDPERNDIALCWFGHTRSLYSELQLATAPLKLKGLDQFQHLNQLNLNTHFKLITNLITRQIKLYNHSWFKLDLQPANMTESILADAVNDKLLLVSEKNDKQQLLEQLFAIKLSPVATLKEWQHLAFLLHRQRHSALTSNEYQHLATLMQELAAVKIDSTHGKLFLKQLTIVITNQALLLNFGEIIWHYDNPHDYECLHQIFNLEPAQVEYNPADMLALSVDIQQLHHFQTKQQLPCLTAVTALAQIFAIDHSQLYLLCKFDPKLELISDQNQEWHLLLNDVSYNLHSLPQLQHCRTTIQQLLNTSHQTKPKFSSHQLAPMQFEHARYYHNYLQPILSEQGYLPRALIQMSNLNSQFEQLNVNQLTLANYHELKRLVEQAASFREQLLSDYCRNHQLQIIVDSDLASFIELANELIHAKVLDKVNILILTFIASLDPRQELRDNKLRCLADLVRAAFQDKTSMLAREFREISILTEFLTAVASNAILAAIYSSGVLASFLAHSIALPLTTVGISSGVANLTAFSVGFTTMLATTGFRVWCTLKRNFVLDLHLRNSGTLIQRQQQQLISQTLSASNLLPPLAHTSCDYHLSGHQIQPWASNELPQLVNFSTNQYLLDRQGNLYWYSSKLQQICRISLQEIIHHVKQVNYKVSVLNRLPTLNDFKQLASKMIVYQGQLYIQTGFPRQVTPLALTKLPYCLPSALATCPTLATVEASAIWQANEEYLINQYGLYPLLTQPQLLSITECQYDLDQACLIIKELFDKNQQLPLELTQQLELIPNYGYLGSLLRQLKLQQSDDEFEIMNLLLTSLKAKLTTTIDLNHAQWLEQQIYSDISQPQFWQEHFPQQPLPLQVFFTQQLAVALRSGQWLAKLRQCRNYSRAELYSNMLKLMLSASAGYATVTPEVAKSGLIGFSLDGLIAPLGVPVGLGAEKVVLNRTHAYCNAIRAYQELVVTALTHSKLSINSEIENAYLYVYNQLQQQSNGVIARKRLHELSSTLALASSTDQELIQTLTTEQAQNLVTMLLILLSIDTRLTYWQRYES